MRQDYGKFKEQNTEIVALGPDGPRAFKRYWEEQDIPFVGLPDIHSAVADRYHQEVNAAKKGRMPALFVIDRQGIIRYSQYGDDKADIPANKDILEIVEEINAETEMQK